MSAEASELIADITRMIYGLRTFKGKQTWRRLRIAVTQAEVDALKQWFDLDNKNTSNDTFIYALRGIPLVIEDHPEHPMIRIEPFNVR